MRWRNLPTPWRVALAVAVTWLFGAAFLLALLVMQDRYDDLPSSFRAVRGGGSLAAWVTIVAVAFRARRPRSAARSTTTERTNGEQQTFRPGWSPLLWAGLPVTASCGVFVALTGLLPTAASVAFAGVTLLASAGLAWTLVTSRYQIREEALIIAFPPFQTVVPWEQMTSARIDRPIGTDRLTLELSSGKQVKLLLPTERDGFLRAIRLRAPDLELG